MSDYDVNMFYEAILDAHHKMYWWEGKSCCFVGFGSWVNQ